MTLNVRGRVADTLLWCWASPLLLAYNGLDTAHYPSVIDVFNSLTSSIMNAQNTHVPGKIKGV